MLLKHVIRIIGANHVGLRIPGGCVKKVDLTVTLYSSFNAIFIWAVL